MGFFKVFSKLRLTIWFHLLEKEGIIILIICAKLKVQVIFLPEIEGQMGSKWDKNGFFVVFSKSVGPI